MYIVINGSLQLQINHYSQGYNFYNDIQNVEYNFYLIDNNHIDSDLRQIANDNIAHNLSPSYLSKIAIYTSDDNLIKEETSGCSLSYLNIVVFENNDGEMQKNIVLTLYADN